MMRTARRRKQETKEAGEDEAGEHVACWTSDQEEQQARVTQNVGGAELEKNATSYLSWLVHVDSVVAP